MASWAFSSLLEHTQPHPTLKSLRAHRLLSLKLPIPETKTRPELALWLPTHSDLISDSVQRASSQHGELPPSFLTDPRNGEFPARRSLRATASAESPDMSEVLSLYGESKACGPCPSQATLSCKPLPRAFFPGRFLSLGSSNEKDCVTVWRGRRQQSWSHR